jgi:serine-type D-Ala-D-Ala endopeptidase (penicillin-binding protein 7)
MPSWMPFDCLTERIVLGMASRFGIAVLGLSLFVFNCAGAVSPIVPRVPQLRSAAAIVQDQNSGEFLLAKQSDIAMPIASITKLMTAMVVLDADLDMNSVITISESDKDFLRHSHSRLPVGMKLSLNESMLLALMASENRAAYALGRAYPGGVGALVKAMNQKARKLGLQDTRFEDPTGLSEGNVSSAKDLSRLVDAAYRYPTICRCTTQSDVTIRHGRRQLSFRNTNPLVRSSRWQIGLSKTGYIEEGGRCLVMQAQLAQRQVLIVLLNSEGRNTRVGDANRIKRWMEAGVRK